jgi:hypothetical protein
MANHRPIKIVNGKRKRFVSGDTVNVDNGGTGLSSIPANSILGAVSLDNYSAFSLPLSVAYGGTGSTTGTLANIDGGGPSTNYGAQISIDGGTP